jgi:PPOX class probable F420-dependent enzyme
VWPRSGPDVGLPHLGVAEAVTTVLGYTRTTDQEGPVSPPIATARRVDRPELLEFLRPRHRGMLVTTRGDGRPQLSPVSFGVDQDERIVIATYPARAKVGNVRRDSRASLCGQSDDWSAAYVQVDGRGEVLDLPEALEPLVDYYRSVAGEHPDWDAYRAAMIRQRKCLIRIEIERWGPIATGGFPPDVSPH